jgi:hypothetical protein
MECLVNWVIWINEMGYKIEDSHWYIEERTS